MLCQNCMKNEANTHIKQTINGETTESYLCFECYTKLRHGNTADSLGFGFGDFLNKFFSDNLLLGSHSEVLRCPKCGNTYEAIANKGKVGCEKCYEVFYDNMKSSLQKIHGKVKHVGKVPKAKDGGNDEQ